MTLIHCYQIVIAIISKNVDKILIIPEKNCNPKKQKLVTGLEIRKIFMNVIWTFQNKFWSVKSISEASKMKIKYLFKAKTKILTKLALPGAHLVGEEIDPLSSKNFSEQGICLKKTPKGCTKLT